MIGQFESRSICDSPCSHPYDELALHKAIQNFITLAADKEPALATLFITGKSCAPGN